MSSDTLKFGPEWLRALSDGNTASVPPTIAGTTKYKLAENRYGREEMLALYRPDDEIPPELAEFPAILVEKAQKPLVIVPLTEEEQRIMSQSVNSSAVLRMFGRGAPSVRGTRGTIERGRGRGRGRGDGYYGRGSSYEDGEGGGFGRGRAPPRETWDERGLGEESSSPKKAEFMRSMSSGNWRERDDDENTSEWRRAGPSREKWGATHTRGAWRDGSGRGISERSHINGPHRDRGGLTERARQYQRSRSSESWDDDDLPEWSVTGSEEIGDLGTFDSSGAFVSNKLKGNNKYRHPTDDSEKQQQNGNSLPPRRSSQETKAPDKNEEQHQEKGKIKLDEKQSQRESHKQCDSDIKKSFSDKAEKLKSPTNSSSQDNNTSPNSNSATNSLDNSISPKLLTDNSSESQSPVHSVKHTPPNLKQDLSFSGKTEAEAIEHMKMTAEHMAAVIADSDNKEESKDENGSEAVPLDHENALKWIYKDPQGVAQGPFPSNEMAEWFSAGYFTMNLLVKRCCDEKFLTLGDLIKRWGRVPFLPGPSLPPVMNEPHTSAELNKQQEQIKALQQQFIVQQQLMQQQMLMRQMQMQQQMTQVLQQLQEQDSFKALPLLQQQQIAMQMMMKQSQQVLLHQQIPVTSQSPNLLPEASSTQSLPGFQRSLSQPMELTTQHQLQQPEDTSIWGGVNPSVSASWMQQLNKTDLDLPQSFIFASDLENQIGNSKKEEVEKRKREEEEQKRRLELLQKQEEIKKQKEEMQRQMEELQREKEELERKKQLERQREEEARHLEEARKQEEIRQQEEARRVEKVRKLEEARRAEEEKRRLEELRLQQEEEERRKKEEEIRLQWEEELRKQEEKRLEQLKLEEEERKQQEKERKQQEKELQRIQELRRKEEQKLREEAFRRQKEEEERQIQKEKEEQQLEMQRQQQEIQRQQQDALKRLQQQQQEQLANLQLPSSVNWANQNNPTFTKNTKTIQELQAEDKRELEQQRLEEERRLQQLFALQELERQQQQAKSWASQVFPSANSSMKSLKEIQEEEQRQLEKENKRKQQQQQQSTVKNLPLNTATVWGSSHPQTISSSSWATDGTWGNVLKANVSANAMTSGTSSSIGFWDDAIVAASKKPTTSNRKPTGEFPALGNAVSRPNTNTSQKAKPSKSKKEEEVVQKLFQPSTPVDEFTQWCEKSLRSHASSVDIPTFIAFLQEVECPFEVHDYVRSYLGENKAAQEFAKGFLEKRSQYKKKIKQQKQVEEDSIWGPAPAVNPRETRQSTQGSDFESQKGKASKKKKRMQKVDASILGFTVQADPDRINIGEIDSGL